MQGRQARRRERIGEDKRRRRDAEVWWFQMKVTIDEFVEHLVVTPATDAVRKLVNEQQPKEHRQCRCSWCQAKVVTA